MTAITPLPLILSQDSGISGIVGERIYEYGMAPKGTPKPYITWFIITGQPNNNLSDPPPDDNYVIQVDIWSSSSNVELRNLVRDAIERHSYITSWGGHDRDDKTQDYRVTLTCDWFVNR
jgi:hypothetical protein